MSTVENLWPSDLVIENPRTPVALLRQQAEILRNTTASRLVGRVDSRVTAAPAQFK